MECCHRVHPSSHSSDQTSLSSSFVGVVGWCSGEFKKPYFTKIKSQLNALPLVSIRTLSINDTILSLWMNEYDRKTKFSPRRKISLQQCNTVHSLRSINSSIHPSLCHCLCHPTSSSSMSPSMVNDRYA
jgi:hypothetical protein